MIRAMNSVDTAVFCDLLSYHRTVRFRGLVSIIDGKRRAMVGYDDFTENSAQGHIWVGGKNGLTANFLRECFTYAYITCNLGLLITVVRCNNAASLELTQRLGFRRILTIKDGYALGTDLAIQEMRREECRWLTRSIRGRQS